MRKVNHGPGHARRATEDGEHHEPGEEKDEYICSPDPRVREPLGIPIQIRRRRRLHVQIRHSNTNFAAILMNSEKPQFFPPPISVSIEKPIYISG